MDAIIAHPLVRAVTLTGSGPAGRAVAKKAGEMLKKSVLELGGADAYLVLEDADIAFAARACAAGRLINSGQSCIAAKRFIVVESVLKAFEEAFVKEMADTKVGDPLLPEIEVGPLARVDLRDALHEQVEKSIAKGARRLLGGKVPDGPGAFYPPTVLTDLRPGMPAYEEELFGPVAASSRRRTKRRPSLSPIALSLASAAGCLPATSRAANARRRAMRRLRVRERAVRVRPGCPLGASKRAATAGSFRTTASGIREHQDRCGRGRHRQGAEAEHRVIRRETNSSMSDNTAIEWCDATWNPTTGCTKITTGCDRCYAARFAERFRNVPAHPYRVRLRSDLATRATAAAAQLEAATHDFRRFHERRFPQGHTTHVHRPGV